MGNTRAIINIFARVKAKRLKAWTCEANVKRENINCVQSDYENHCHDRKDYNQNTMERPRTFGPAGCKQGIRHP